MSQNPYQTTDYGYGNVKPISSATVDERSTFIRKTYVHLCGAVLLFAALEAIVLNVFWDQLAAIVPKATGMIWLVVLGLFMGVGYVANRWAHSETSRKTQYLGLGLYVLAEVLIFIPLLFFAHLYNENIILAAGVVTAIVFGGLTATCFLTKFDFSFLRYALMIGMFAAIGLIVASMFVGFDLGLWFSVAMVVLAAGYILYNTSNIIHHYHTGQYVAASLALFASVALLFWYVVQIFMHASE